MRSWRRIDGGSRGGPSEKNAGGWRRPDNHAPGVDRLRDVNGNLPGLAIIGGSGALGSGLVRRWASLGFSVTVGSRDVKRTAEDMANMDVGPEGIQPRATDIAEAASAGDVIIMAVPFGAQAEVADVIREHAMGKLIIDTTVPLVPPKLTQVQLPPADSAAVTLRRCLGEGARVVSAFHNIPARKLRSDTPIDCDVLVFGDDPADRQIAIFLADAAGMRGVHGGHLVNSTAAEALTSVLIGIGQIYKVDGAGIRITGLD